MKKTLVILTALLMLCGCDVKQDKHQISQRYAANNIVEICIDGVSYLIYSGFKKGGIVPKLKVDGSLYTCKQGENNE